MANTSQNEPSSFSAEDVAQSPESAAMKAVESGEVCVSEHPVSSIASAFVGGMVLGGLIGWAIAQAHHHSYREACRDVAKDWLHRLHLD